MTKLETERLLLRPPELRDTPAMARWMSDYDIAKNLSTAPHPYSEENARAGITTSALYDDGKGEAKLVFHKVGERYFLSQVWMDNGGIQVPMSRQEKGLLAQHGNGSTYAVMTVALSPIR